MPPGRAGRACGWPVPRRVRLTRRPRRSRSRRAWAGWPRCSRRTRRTTARSISACLVSTWSDGPDRPVTLERATVPPALCIVAQGAKTVMLGREVYSYDASRLVAYAVDLPIAGQVIRASQREPFLVLVLKLDPYKIAELTLKVYPHGVPSPQSSRGVIVGPDDDGDRRCGGAPRRVDGRTPRRRSCSPRSSSTRSSFASCGVAIGPRVAQIGQQGVERPAGGQGGVVGARALRAADHARSAGRPGPHERVVVPPALQGGHRR